jgi:plastocyanin
MRRFTLLVAIVALIAGGCAKEAAKPEAEEEPAGSPPVTLTGAVNNHGTKTASGTVEMEQDNFYFEPSFLKAAPGTTVKVELRNEGSVPHTFTIDALHIDQTVEPGKSASVSVDVPSGNATRFYCRFHESRGMQGAVFTATGQSVGVSTGGSAPPGGSGY